MKKIFLATAILAASSATFAAGPNYNYLQGQWQESELDGSNAELDGFGLAASIDLNKEFFAFGQYASIDDRGVDADRFAVGAAYKMPIGTYTDLNFGGGIVSYDFKNFSLDGDDSDEGIMLTAGIRSLLNKEVELGAGVTYEDAFDFDMLFNVYGAYHFNSQISAGVSLTTGDVDTTALYVRVAF
ncbi:outer membrane beta-barrel protein [Permianibacter sp. IMCC34836]|uniref:outer membrane beta-barrel protein n=1 Tax=Permianibacter fluminis TaxID=2738515 RepID=UPI001557A5D0|nr:outer membrane beta-barrel protein [Permianibacter fluminis]NQD37281.1 outer membrane beta-barrel protein [Permianibacter fluminis]